MQQRGGSKDQVKGVDQLIDELVGQIGQQTYSAGSSAFHAGTARAKVRKLTGWVFAILDEILPDLSRSSSPQDQACPEDTTTPTGYQSVSQPRFQFGHLLRPVTPCGMFALAAADLDLPAGSQTDTPDELSNDRRARQACARRRLRQRQSVHCRPAAGSRAQPTRRSCRGAQPARVARSRGAAAEGASRCAARWPASTATSTT